MAIGFVYALIFTLASFLSDKYGWNISPVFFGISWVLAQHLLANTLFPFPIETALAAFPAMIQSARIFGSHFIAFLIIASNALLANAIVKKNKRIWAITISILLLVHLVILGYGNVSMNSTQNLRKPVNIAIVQTNISSKDFALKERNKLFEKLVNKKVVDLSIDALEKHPQLIIWPELSGDYALQNDDYLEYLHSSVTSKGPELLIGTSYIDHCNGRKKYNIAFILKTDGDMTEPYRKNRIFPLFETQWASRGKGYVTLPSNTPLKDIGCMICLESLCPQIARGLAGAEAKILVCISSDTSFGNSIVPYIHSASMIFRAIENDMFGIHVGNSGPSIVCDNKGRVLAQIPYGRTAYGNAVIR